MREYKGKRVDTGEWITGYYVFLHDDKGNSSHRIYTGYAESDCGDFYPDWFEVEPGTVGQHTGKEDKYGNPIFNGMEPLINFDAYVKNEVAAAVEKGVWKPSDEVVEMTVRKLSALWDLIHDRSSFADFTNVFPGTRLVTTYESDGTQPRPVELCFCMDAETDDEIDLIIHPGKEVIILNPGSNCLTLPMPEELVWDMHIWIMLHVKVTVNVDIIKRG